MIKEKKSLKKKLMIVALSALVILMSSICGYAVYHYNDVKYWNDLIYPGVFVENIDLSGKTKAEAKDIIKKTYLDQIQKKKINIEAADKKYTLEYSAINPKYKVDEAVNSAYSYGKDMNLFRKYLLLKNPEKLEYKLKFSYDVKPLKDMVNQIENEVNRDPVDASLVMRRSGFEVISEQDGLTLQKDKLEKELLAKVDGSVGKDLSIKSPVQSTPARIKGEDIKGVDTLISSFNTNYGSISSPQRANNIVLATRSINGRVLMPGDIFSFNEVVGERTHKKGYQAAPVIIGDKLEDGLGGGVCQVSSALYNAAYAAGLQSVERTHHTLPVHYVPEGMDATVDFGNIDYKFKNNFKYPIYVEGYTTGGTLVFNIYSNSSVLK